MNAKQILEALNRINEDQNEDAVAEIIYKAQDIAEHASNILVNKLQEHLKNGFYEDFYNLILRVSVILNNENGKYRPNIIIDEIGSLAENYVQEQDEDDKKWLLSCIDTEMNKLDVFFKSIKETTEK